jgi:hypothetical protein
MQVLFSIDSAKSLFARMLRQYFPDTRIAGVKERAMKRLKILLLLITAATLSTQLTAQEPRYWGPSKGDTFFPIGWNSESTVFAYGVFMFSPMISNRSSISVVIQDVITDEALWSAGNYWEEGNVGDGSGYCPYTAPEAYEFIAEEVDGALEEWDILGNVIELRSFPMSGENAVSIEIDEYDPYKGFDIFAHSPSRGWKRISRWARLGGQNELTVEGYILSPDAQRILLIVQSSTFDMPFFEYLVIGCHLTAGYGEKPVAGMP